MKLYCPYCIIPLEQSQKKLLCRRCQRTYKVENGVPIFIEKSLYWGEIPRSEMELINKRIKKEYWKDVLKNSSSESVRNKRNFIENLTRANFHFLCHLNNDATILDVGSGMGTISESLSYYYKRVIAIEPVMERIVFSATRFKQEKIENIQLICTDLHNLPFSEETFDLIVMNGVLEWVALYDPHKPPEVVQREILERLYRLLKPAGVLYIGIENRIGFTYLLGRIDHSYLPYTSLMPRFLANRITRARKGHPYRTYTYTIKGYRNLLSKSGFKEIEFFYPHRGYNNPRQIVPLNSKTLHVYFAWLKRGRRQLKTLLKRFLALSGAFNWLAPDFLILSRKGRIKQLGGLEKVISKAIAKTTFSGFLNKLSFIVNNTSQTHITFLVLMALNKQPFLVASMALKERFNRIIERECKNIKYIRSLLPESMKLSIPKPILLGYIENRAIFVKSFMQGYELRSLMNKKNFHKTAYHVAKWLLEFHQIFRNEKILFEKKRINEIYYLQMKQFAKKTKLNVPNDFYSWAEEKVKKYANILVPMSPQHGDFWHGNIVRCNDHFGIFDWEFFGEVDLPLFDLFHFLTMFLTSPEIFGKNREKNFALLFSVNRNSRVMADIVSEIAYKMGIDKELIAFLYFLYLLNFYEKISSRFLSAEISRDVAQFIKEFISLRENFILYKG